MARYDHLVYGRYAHLLRDYFKELKSIFKKEVYNGAYEIYLPLQFRSIYPYAQIPFSAVAVLWMSFEYDTFDGKKHHSRYCYLDASGYRIPDNSVRQFNDRIDAWLEKVYELREKKQRWLGYD
jgi:hypothetical protein